MSLPKNKQTKAKQKGAPKLKNVLANPYQIRYPSLSENDVEQLKALLIAASSNNAKEARTIATKKHIHLGLESSVRAMNNGQCSLVLLSLSIKPRFLISMIGRNAEAKHENVPVFVQPHLESFTEEIFGVRSLSLVLPKDVSALTADLQEWLSSHRKPEKPSTVEMKKEKKSKKKESKVKAELIKNLSEKAESEPEIQKDPEELVSEARTDTKSKKWSGDFISFSNGLEDIEMDKVELEEDKNQLLGALGGLAKQAKKVEKKTLEVEMVVDEEKAADNADIVTESIDSEDDGDMDEFLKSYQPTKIIKFHTNPSRPAKKAKKKAKKNKKKT